MAPTYYEILAVAQNATAEEIEAAFKSRAKEVHPDTVAPGNSYLQEVAAEAFKDLSEAKAVLLDPAGRQKYDAELAGAGGKTKSYATCRTGAFPSDGATFPDRRVSGAGAEADRAPQVAGTVWHTPWQLVVRGVGFGLPFFPWRRRLERENAATGALRLMDSACAALV